MDSRAKTSKKGVLVKTRASREEFGNGDMAGGFAIRYNSLFYNSLCKLWAV